MAKKKYILDNCRLIVQGYDCDGNLEDIKYDILINSSTTYTTDVSNSVVTFVGQDSGNTDIDITFSPDTDIFFLVDATDTPIAAATFEDFLNELETERAACNCCGGGGGGSTPSTNTNVTSTNITTSTSGSTTAGVWEVSVANVGGADGTFNGATLAAGVTIVYRGYKDDTTNQMKRLASMAYDATGTTFLIVEIP